MNEKIHSDKSSVDLETTAEGAADSKKSGARHGGNKLFNRRNAIIAGVTGVLLGVSGGAWASSAYKNVTLQVEDETQVVGTWSNSVSAVLKETGVEVSPKDLVVPSLNAAVQEGANIVVHRAKDLQVMVDGQPKTITTTRDNLAEALVEAKTNEPTVSVQAVRNTTGLDFALPLLSSGGTVRVMHDNTTSFGSLVGEANLVQALEAAGVTLGGTDKLTITPASKRGLDIKIVRVTEEDVVLASAIAFNTVEQKDDSLYKGQKRTVQKGVAGEKQSTFHVVREDGQEVSSVVTAETVTRQPQDAIVKVGTQEPPAAPAAPAGAPAGGAGAPAGGVWVALAQCESGGRVNAVSSGGHYHGLYQFSPSTWRSVGGQGLPSQASAEEQTMRAQMLQARSGWGQWPACSRKLGLM